MRVVSFTTIPDRLDSDLPTTCIQSLLRQTLKPDLILVNLPRVSRKGVAYNQEKAATLTTLSPLVTLHWMDVDDGPITKLSGALLYIEEHQLSDVKLILVDDDCQYKESMIQELTAKQREHGVQALGYAGRNIVVQGDTFKTTHYLNYVELQYEPTPTVPTTFLETYAGVIYDADVFLPHKQFRDWYLTLPDETRSTDDIVIGAWIHKRNCKPYLLRTDHLSVTHDPKKTPSLRNTNLVGNNDKVCDFFHKQGDFQTAHRENGYGFVPTLLIRILKFARWFLLAAVLVAIVAYVYRKQLGAGLKRFETIPRIFGARK